MDQTGLKAGDTIGIVAPSRPIFNIKKEIAVGLETLEKMGFRVKRGAHLDERLLFSAGSIEQRLSDLHDMFADQEVKAIICATGGSSSNQLLDKLDYGLVAKNPKPFIGFSDITALLLALNKRTSVAAYYGPTVYELSTLTSDAKNFLFDLLGGENKTFDYPDVYSVIRPGTAEGPLIGGILSRFNSLLPTPYMPDLKGKILFWEEVNVSPATMDFELQTLRLAGVFGQINGMVVGHLSGCIDTKYPEDDREIAEILKDRTQGYDFPIIKTDYFGHDINNFYPLQLGAPARIETGTKKFALI